ncbi:MAG: glycosyltransferase family 39 protein [Chloroflexi bacterium]|nr:glycosyltransferase family 39 protein [Chloroflexota bacterium]
MRLTLERPAATETTPPAPRTGRRVLVLPALVVLLGFVLRTVHLSYDSLDMDEADGAAFVTAGLAALLGRLFQQGENGPLYFLLLGLWSQVAGASEFALRFPSVFFGTIFVALSYATARRLLDQRAALLAALLAAGSTYLIHYAQMVKMYALLALLALWASYLLLLALERPGLRRWAAYVAAVSVAMYTHIFGVLLLPWHISYVLLRSRAYRPALRGWLAATALLTLPYIPLGLWHLDALRTISLLDRQFTGPQDLLGMLATLAREYGTRYDDLPRGAVALFFVALVGLGVLALRFARPGARRPDAALFLGLGIAVPLAVVFILVRLGAPLFASRYLMVTLPAFLLLWAAGLAALSRRHLALLLPALGAFLALNGVYLFITDIQGVRYRENWREAVAYLDSVAQEGDAVLILNSNIVNAYRYYSREPLPVVDLGPLRGLEEDARGRTLAAATQPFRRLWVLFAYFETPDYEPVRPWLEQQTHIQEQIWFRGVRVAEHVPPAVPSFAAPRPTTPVDLSFGRQVQVLGLDRGPLPRGLGQPWQVRLYWKALAQPGADYAASLRLVDAAGTVWGRADGPVGGAFHRTAGWQPGRVVPDERKLWLAPGTPPGTYRLGLRVYREDTQERLPLDGAEAAGPELALLETVVIERPIPAGSGR